MRIKYPEKPVLVPGLGAVYALGVSQDEVAFSTYSSTHVEDGEFRRASYLRVMGEWYKVDNITFTRNGCGKWNPDPQQSWWLASPGGTTANIHAKDRVMNGLRAVCNELMQPPFSDHAELARLAVLIRHHESHAEGLKRQAREIEDDIISPLYQQERALKNKIQGARHGTRF